MNQELLTQTLRTVQREREAMLFDVSFAWVQRLITEEGEEQLTERLDAAIPHTWPWEVVADLVGILVGMTRDNGAAIFRSAEGWLREGTNLRRIQIVLAQHRYPFFHDPAAMERILSGIAQRFPAVADRCADLITSRKRVKD